MPKTLLEVFSEEATMEALNLSKEMTKDWDWDVTYCLGALQPPGWNPATAEVDLDRIQSRFVNRPGKLHPKEQTECLGCGKWFTLVIDDWAGWILRNHKH